MSWLTSSINSWFVLSQPLSRFRTCKFIFFQNKIKAIFVKLGVWLCFDYIAQMWIFAAMQGSGIRWSRDVQVSELTPTSAERGSCHKWWQVDWGEWNRTNLREPLTSILQSACEQRLVLKLLWQKESTSVYFKMKVIPFYAMLLDMFVDKKKHDAVSRSSGKQDFFGGLFLSHVKYS